MGSYGEKALGLDHSRQLRAGGYPRDAARAGAKPTGPGGEGSGRPMPTTESNRGNESKSKKTREDAWCRASEAGPNDGPARPRRLGRMRTLHATMQERGYHHGTTATTGVDLKMSHRTRT
eukprot:scaffold280196_cov30-Tisochrysis_lutea.AAC.4